MVLCAGDRRVDATRLSLSPAPADRVREVTGFSIGGVPPLGHEVDLPTIVDESLLRFPVVWAAADAARRLRRRDQGARRASRAGVTAVS